MRKPERWKGEHQRVDPDRHRHQEHEEHRGQERARSPDHAGRRAKETGDDADAQQADLENELKKKQEEEDNKKNNVAITVVDTKKNVFAKFKSYNK